ncbi:hypothetical protein THIOSC15_730006 [uncultured Thiomicrorhabdus sp.]
MLRILTNPETQYRGKVEHHDYQLYLAINDVDYVYILSILIHEPLRLIPKNWHRAKKCVPLIAVLEQSKEVF